MSPRWAVTHALSKGFTIGVVTTILCGMSLRQMRMEVDDTRADNPLLAQGIADFFKGRYDPSRVRLFMQQLDLGSVAGDNKALQDLNWIGSQLPLNIPGYYDTGYSKTPRQSWPYSTARDAGLPQIDDDGSYPTCRQWWTDPGIGLRNRIKSQVGPGLITSFPKRAKWMNQDEVTEAVIRQVISPSDQAKDSAYIDHGGQVGGTVQNGTARIAGTFGVVLGSLVYFPAMGIARQTLPTVMSFLKMAMIIYVLMVLVTGIHQLRVITTMTVVFLAMMFIDFWFQLTRYIGSTILGAFYGSGSPHPPFDPATGLNMVT